MPQTREQAHTRQRRPRRGSFATHRAPARAREISAHPPVAEQRHSVVRGAPRAAVGRPTKRTRAICDEILDRIADGETLRAICRREGMPSCSAFYDWLGADAELAARFARAREFGFDAIAEECLHIIDSPLEDVETIRDARGVTVRRGDTLERRRLQVETRLKLLAKWDPKRYGNRRKVDGTGAGRATAAALAVAWRRIEPDAPGAAAVSSRL